MFEGTPITSLDRANFTLFCLSLVLAAGVVWIRQRFLKEWKLANWVIFKINRIWQRGADEVPQAEGIIVSHLIGIWALGLIGYLVDEFLYGLIAGILLFIIRQLTFWALSFYSKTKIISFEHNLVDRVVRMWFSTGVSAATIIFSLVPQIDTFYKLIVIISLWWLVVAFRWVRVLQSANRRLNNILLAFMYLCALEILPFMVLMKLIVDSINA